MFVVFSSDDEYGFFCEYARYIESRIECVYGVPDNHREHGRYDICIEDDESRDLSSKYKSSGQIDKSDIYKKPKKTIRHDLPYLLDDRSVCSERVESSSDEYDTPDDDA